MDSMGGVLGDRTSLVEEAAPTSAEAVAQMREVVTRLARARHKDSECVELLTELERLKHAAAAAQADASAALEASVTEQRAHLPREKRAQGVAHQIALARSESPHRGSRHLGLAKALVHEMPCTLEVMRAGKVSEWGTTLIVQATACLSAEERGQVDQELAPRLPHLSDRKIGAAARALAYRLDGASFVAQSSKAARDRRVTSKPAPDVMATLTALLPAAQAVACVKALEQHAAAQRSAGDTRSRDQIKADTFVERITGQQRAPEVPIEVGLVMTDGTMLHGAETPARLEDYGPLPAQVARDLIDPKSHEPEGHEARMWLRRLWLDPVTGSLADQDRRRRRFTGALRRYIIARDQHCRTPYCDAPVRHVDHITPFGQGGATQATNGQGLCERCNYVKETDGWQVTAASHRDNSPSRTVVTVTAPTGHTVTSSPPPLLEALATGGRQTNGGSSRSDP